MVLYENELKSFFLDGKNDWTFFKLEKSYYLHSKLQKMKMRVEMAGV